jgi:hypothetical protein
MCDTMPVSSMADIALRIKPGYHTEVLCLGCIGSKRGALAKVVVA